MHQNTYPFIISSNHCCQTLDAVLFLTINILLPRATLCEDQSPSVSTTVNLYLKYQPAITPTPLQTNCVTHPRLVAFEGPDLPEKNLPSVNKFINIITIQVNFRCIFK